MSITPSLIVGLGNPGPKYAGTRHNAGYMVVERLYESLAAPEPEVMAFSGCMASGVFAGLHLRLLKPLTSMNNSGVAVREAVAALGLTAAEVLVVYDCMDLPLGRLRLKRGGSSGGHRGVASIIRELETDTFPRLRVGIGRPESETIEHVLSTWASAELPIVDKVVTAATTALHMVLREGFEAAMNRYNGWNAADEHDATEDQENSR